MSDEELGAAPEETGAYGCIKVQLVCSNVAQEFDWTWWHVRTLRDFVILENQGTRLMQEGYVEFTAHHDETDLITGRRVVVEPGDVYQEWVE